MATRYTVLGSTPAPITTDGPQGTGSLRTISTGNPQNLGSPTPGSATSASASDHVHQMPNAGDVGAIPSAALTVNNPASLGSLAAPGSSPNVARLDHVHPFPTASNVGADPTGSAATAELNAQSYTDAAIKAASISSGRVVLVNLTGVPNLSAVTLNTLDPLYTPVQNDEVLITGACSPDGVILASTAYAGVYTVGVVTLGVAPLTRAANYDESAEICGATWFVTGGTYSDDFWACTNDVASTTIDVTPLVFVQIAGTLSNNAAQPLGAAGASGTDHDVSRSDHVHPFPTASNVGAIPTTALTSTTPSALGTAGPGSSSDVARVDHVHAMPSFPPAMIPLSGYATVGGNQGTMAIGGSPYPIINTDYLRTGLTATWQFVFGGSVTSGDTGTVVLWDVAAASAVATVSVTSTTAATSHTAAFTPPSSPSPAKTYELRASVSGGTAADYVVVNSAALRITWS